MGDAGTTGAAIRRAGFGFFAGFAEVADFFILAALWLIWADFGGDC
jgi:hypothetical protein